MHFTTEKVTSKCDFLSLKQVYAHFCTALYVDVHKVSMAFREDFWMARHVFKFPAEMNFFAKTCCNLVVMNPHQLGQSPVMTRAGV